jgi:DNA modification methylase
MSFIEVEKSIKIIDYREKYSNLVSFNNNKNLSVHRWYSFVEGYSSELVKRIIGEQKFTPSNCLEPFGGIGTTSLSCQDLNIKCHSIEVNPFFYDVTKAKLSNFDSKKFEDDIVNFASYLKRCKAIPKIPILESKTFFQNEEREKWIFDISVTHGIFDILERINEIKDDNNENHILFKIALANQLVPSSNVFRNGKCMSFRKNWKDKSISREEFHSNFINFCISVLLVDIRSRENMINTVYNSSTCYNGDSRKVIRDINDKFDLIITSPPYLNSRDYTDVYRLELWILGYIDKFVDERSLRRSSLTSHVQIQLPETEYPDVDEINTFLLHLKSLKGNLWNKNIPNMIKGYFNDMDILINQFYHKLNIGGKAYINVSNSSYGNKICEVDLILAKIAEKNNLEVEEIRIARNIGSSSQQNIKSPVRESVIVLKKS